MAGLIIHNHDLQNSFIEMEKDKNLYRDQNEALDQKVSDLGHKITTLENRLRYSQEDTRKANADLH